MSFSPDYLGGGFSATFVDVVLTGDLDFGAATVQSLNLGDDDQLTLGGSDDSVFVFDTTDANANMLKLGLPAGTATEVPYLLLGLDSAITGVDNGFADGGTNPTLAIVSPDGTDFLFMSATDAGVGVDSNVGISVGGTNATGLVLGRAGTVTSVNATFNMNGTTNNVAGQTIYDSDVAEQLLCRKNGDALDVFTVDTSADRVLVGGDLIVAPEAGTTGTPTGFTYTDPAHTGMTASTSAASVHFDLSSTKEWATGALSSQAAFLVSAPTYAFAGASALFAAGTMVIDGMPIEGANATISVGAAFIVGNAAGYTSGIANAAHAGLVIIPGIDDGVGAVTQRTGLYVGGDATGAVSLGDQTNTLTNLRGIEVAQVTYNSDTLTRTVTNPASLYVEGAPVAGTNVAFTNGPYAVWVAGEDSRFDGNVLVGSTTASAKIDVTVADTENLIGIEINQNDTTNNPRAVDIINAGTGNLCRFSQIGELAASTASVSVSSGTAQTNANNSLFSTFSNAANTAGSLVRFTDNNTSSTHDVVILDDHTSGSGIYIDKDSNNASDTYAIKIDSDNAGAGTGCGIDMSSFSVDEPLVKAPTDAITSAGTVSHQIAVDIGGTTYYLVAYTHGT